MYFYINQRSSIRSFYGVKKFTKKSTKYVWEMHILPRRINKSGRRSIRFFVLTLNSPVMSPRRTLHEIALSYKDHLQSDIPKMTVEEIRKHFQISILQIPSSLGQYDRSRYDESHKPIPPYLAVRLLLAARIQIEL